MSVGIYGYMAFPGVQSVRRGVFTMGHGIQPGIATLEIAPQAYVPPAVGVLQIVYGGVFLGFPNCVIDNAAIRYDPSGYVVGLRILDRRWLWRFGTISGYYNHRKNNGELRTETQKTPQELAVLCLQAMGESQYNVGDLPNFDRPSVTWDNDNPAAVLADLCDQMGCVIVLGLDNTVSIRRRGVGAPLPSVFARTADDAVAVSVVPEKIRVVCGPTRFQSRFSTRAVGLDTDGKVKFINDLSYKPSQGWSNEDPFVFPTLRNAVLASPTSADAIEKLALAQRTVWRWYWIDGIADGTDKTTYLTGYGDVARWQLLPFGNELVKTFTNPEGDVIGLPAKAYGGYFDRNVRLASTPDGSLMDVPFTITGSGIAQFNDPIFKIDDTGGFSEPTIVVETSCGVLDPNTRAPVRHSFEATVATGIVGSGTQTVEREDLVRTIQTLYDSGLSGTKTGETDSNATTDLPQQLEYQWQASSSEYANTTAQSAEYAGILPISLDGAIQQVEWAVGPEGHTTRSSRNTEVSLRLPSYRRVQELTVAAAKDRYAKAADRQLRELKRKKANPIAIRDVGVIA